MAYLYCYVLLLILFGAITMYGSVPQSEGRSRVWVKATSTHLKGDSICLNYDYPKILSFIAAMGLKVHPHF